MYCIPQQSKYFFINFLINRLKNKIFINNKIIRKILIMKKKVFSKNKNFF